MSVRSHWICSGCETRLHAGLDGRHARRRTRIRARTVSSSVGGRNVWMQALNRSGSRAGGSLQHGAAWSPCAQIDRLTRVAHLGPLVRRPYSISSFVWPRWRAMSTFGRARRSFDIGHSAIVQNSVESDCFRPFKLTPAGSIPGQLGMHSARWVGRDVRRHACGPSQNSCISHRQDRLRHFWQPRSGPHADPQRSRSRSRSKSWSRWTE